MSKITTKNRKCPRCHRVVVSLNDEENRFIESFCTKNNIASKSKFFRETVIKSVLQQLYNYSPTLFD